MTHELLNFILALAIIIAAAKVSGYLSTRLGQPSVLGELLAGIILGPTVLNMLNAWPVFAEDHLLPASLALLAELGVILLMMLAGLALHMSELLHSGKVAALGGTLGVITPLALGWGTARLFGVDNVEALYIGLALAATSVSISAQTLMELNVLRSRVGLALLGAAVFDDILVILLLSLASILVGTAAGGYWGIVFTVLWMIAYLVGASVIGLRILPRAVTYVSRLPISQSVIAFVLCSCLLYAWSAEVIGGMAPITGAFLIGLFLARSPQKNQIEAGISAIAYGFVVPVFFVSIGLQANMRAISGEAWWFALAITLVAVVSKIVGCGAGGLMSGLNTRDSLRLGIGMVSRGEVGLIVAAFAVNQGFMTQSTFALMVFMVIVTTLITPPMLRAVYPSLPPAESGMVEPAS